MSDTWKQMDLEGGGLQSASLRLARVLRHRRRAYALWIAFPLGLHRDYLAARKSAWGWRLATLATAMIAVWSDPRVAAVAAAVMLAFAVYDLFWIDRRVTALNKALRKDVYLSQTAPGAPSGFRGRFTDEPAPPAANQDTDRPRAPSFAEQERLLREIAAQRRKDPVPRD